MMKPFLKSKWKCKGNDPIKSYAEWGKNKYKLPVEWMQSEDMKLKKNSLDLIIIMGSIEHVVDLNETFSFINKLSIKGTILSLNGIHPRLIDIDSPRWTKLKEVAEVK